jgi:hypothetical protein
VVERLIVPEAEADNWIMARLLHNPRMLVILALLSALLGGAAEAKTIEELISDAQRNQQGWGESGAGTASWRRSTLTERERALTRLDHVASQEDSLALILPATYRPLSIRRRSETELPFPA